MCMLADLIMYHNSMYIWKKLEVCVVDIVGSIIFFTKQFYSPIINVSIVTTAITKI